MATDTRISTANRRMLASCFLGTTIEWYDFLVYGFLAPLVFDRLCFPRLSPLIGTIAVFGVFALGFAARPLGGIFFAHLGDRVGRKPIMVSFGILGMILTVPIFTALETVRDPAAAFVLVLAALLIVTGYTSINAVVKAELFPAHIRALGVALPYALANTLFGGTAEYAALWFKDAGIERAFYWYVTAMIGLSLIVYLTMRDTKRHSLILED